MEPIDAAKQVFDSALAEIEKYLSSVVTEEDTRMKVINRVLVDVLNWPLGEIRNEDPAGPGFIDYKLCVSGLAKAVVEAKRDGRSLGLEGRTPGRAFRLDGAVFRSEAAKEGIEQAIKYCGRKNAELACVTNGREWIVFRGSRLGDGKDTTEGVAFVFPGLPDVSSHFALFYDLLSFEGVKSFKYRALFQEAEGRPIRSSAFRRTVYLPESRRLLDHDNLSGDAERVMTSFFRRLSGDDDPELLQKCFVVTKESELADQKLARISEDLVSRIRSIETQDGGELTRLIERVRQTQRNEFVLLVGTKGAGKSTFIDRFFAHVLPRAVREDCIIAKVNLADSPGDETSIVDWMNNNLLSAVENAIFEDRDPTFDEITGMFYDEYRRMSKGTLSPLYGRDKEQFKSEFGKHVERRREERPHDYICRLLDHVVKLRKKVPCLILDNADHFTIQFQERVFQYARSIYERQVCMVIMPITDRTSWQLSREGALRSFETESLYLPTPSPKIILQRRISYIEDQILEEKRTPGRGYFIGRGIPLTIDNLVAFTATLQSLFLKTGQVAWWIGNLANRDIRRCLELAKGIITSPHLEVGQLVKSYIVGSAVDVPQFRIKRAIVRGRYDIYPVGDHAFVRNIFAADEHFETSPLLGIRVLQLLRDTQKSEPENPFVGIDQTIEYFRAMLVEPVVLMSWLRVMLETGLCQSYDPTVTEIEEARQIQLSPSGFQHLRWGTRDFEYVQAMLQITPISDSDVFERLLALSRKARSTSWKEEIQCFVEYVILEDTKFCRPPDHDAFASQRRLPSEFLKLIPV